MRIVVSSLLAALLMAHIALAAEPVGLGKYSAKSIPSLKDSSTQLEVAKDLVKPVETAVGQDQNTVAGDEAKTEEERPIGVGSIASDIGHAAAVFFSSAVNAANVLRKVFGP